MNSTPENVMTIYGLLARRYYTTEDYVGQVVRGVRKASRGKGQAILKDFNLLQSSLDDWFIHTKYDGSMRVEMPNKVTVYIQDGLASAYKGSELIQETDVSNMTINQFREHLNNIRIDF